jgi:hypothetical protein
VILYETMVATLASLIGLENIAWHDCKLCFKSSTLFLCSVVGIFTYVVFIHGHEMSFNITFLANSYTGTA